MSQSPTPSALRVVLFGALVAGTLDLAYAFTAYGLKGIAPLGILQSIAAGWLGKASYQHGLASALLGLVSHYGILGVATALYLAAARRQPMLVTRAVTCGLAYGLAIYLFMNFVVLPLSAGPHPPNRALDLVVGGVLIHMLGVGLPIALITRRASRPA